MKIGIAGLITGTLIATTSFTSHAGNNGNETWTVERGDTLYSIARKVAPNSGKEQAKVRKYILANSPNAFRNGDPGAMEVGATLFLPSIGAAVVTPVVKAMPKPKPKVSVKPLATPAPKVSAPKPKPVVADTGASNSGFRARLEAKRQAKAEAQRLAAIEAEKQQAAAAAAAAEKAKQEAMQKAARAAAQQKAAEAQRLAQQKRAAEAAERKQAEAMRMAKAAAQMTKPKPKPAPKVTAAPKSSGKYGRNDKNPYVECLTLDPKERCGYWK